MTRVFFRTFGCSLNQSDTEVMKGILEEMDYELVDNTDIAEVLVINSCAVKKPTETKFFKYLDELKALDKPIVITGCIAQTMPKKLEGCGIIGPDNLNSIIQVIEETMHNNPITEIKNKKQERLNTPKIRKNQTIEILPISHGCLGECTYCIVKNARGEFYSYKENQILKQAQTAINQGVKEIWLTSQDTGCYGKDTDTFLPTLIRKIADIEGDFRIRIGMMNPEHIIDMIDDLIDAYQHPKVFKFIHIPLQSGSNKILKKMKRKYTVEQYKEIVNKIRPLTLATDVICGFPGETDKDFQMTLDLIKEIKPDIVNISRFYSRPGTNAQRYKQLTGDITKTRSKKLSTLFEHISWEQNRKWVGWSGRVIVEDTTLARNDYYKPIVLEEEYNPGDTIKVKILKANVYHLLAKPVSSSLEHPSDSSHIV